MYNLIDFPVLYHEGEFRSTWKLRWRRFRGAWQFFGSPCRMVPDEEDDWHQHQHEHQHQHQHQHQQQQHQVALSRRLLTLAGFCSDWGAFDLVGILQLDSEGTIFNRCGIVSTGQNSLNHFTAAGRAIDAHIKTFTEPRDFWLMPDAYYIPGTGTKINLAMVLKHDSDVEVYFLRGKDTGGYVRSQIPGMEKFYRAAKVEKFFAKLADLWNGVCW